jgi:uncharacterized Ntn-hydrolase superfamily protein
MTYSIVARDPETGELGVAVQSHWFAVGQLVPWLASGVGAVATQSFVEVSYGPLGLDLMRAGRSPEAALKALVEADEDAGVRQVAMVNASGRVATHTGDRCIAEASHQVGEGYSVQANMMERPTVPSAMAAAFERSEGPLVERLLQALEAAEGEGGDIRGRQSAALVIVAATPSGKPWEDVTFDLRVDDHPAPLPELRRLVELQQGYTHAQRAEDHELEGDLEGATREYSAALALVPDSSEFAFWAGVSLARAGKGAEARDRIALAFAQEPRLRELLRRIARDGHVDLSSDQVDDLLGATPEG